jgi:hypothetical protein
MTRDAVGCGFRRQRQIESRMEMQQVVELEVRGALKDE